MNHDLFKQYAELKAQRELLEERINTLGTQLIGELQANELEKLSTDEGTYSLIDIPRWTYSPNVTDREAAVKALKAEERGDGTAKSQNTTSLRYQPKVEAKK
jgi:hypothetical protein